MGSKNALWRKKILRRTQLAIKPLDQVSGARPLKDFCGRTYTLPIKNTADKPTFWATGACSFHTMGMGSESMTTSVMMFGSDIHR